MPHAVLVTTKVYSGGLSLKWVTMIPVVTVDNELVIQFQ
jgi:hypothetical protein